MIRCLQRHLEARLDLSINQQESTPESKDPHPIPQPFKILGLGGDWWPFIIWNVKQNLDRSDWNICWSRKCNESAPIPTAWRWHEGIQRVLQAEGDCDLSAGLRIFPQILKVNDSMSSSFNSVTHTSYPHLWRIKRYENAWSYVTPELRNPDQRWEAVRNCHQDLGVMVVASEFRSGQVKIYQDAMPEVASR